MGFGLGEILGELVLVVFVSIPLAISLWALLDCARRPGWAWSLAERSQQMWMAAILCGILSVLGGLVISTYYLMRVRPDVADVEAGKLPDLR